MAGLLNRRHFHFEGGDAGEDTFAILDLSQVGTFRHAVRRDEVIALVMELRTRGQARTFAHHAVAFDHKLGAVRIGHDPFAALDRHHPRAVIVDRDVVDKSVGPVGRAFLVRIIFHTIKTHPKTW